MCYRRWTRGKVSYRSLLNEQKYRTVRNFQEGDGGASAYSPHSKAAAHGALLSRGAAERRPLGRSQAVKVSDRLNLSIPDLGLKRPANELDMVMRVVWCTHRTSRHGHPRPNALWIRSVLYS